MSEQVSIRYEIKGKRMRLPFIELTEKILGKDYELSIAFVSPRVSKQLNTKYRGKPHSTNILSFPLGKKTGELILDQKKITAEAPQFGLSTKNFTLYLLIHGMLHLKGYSHGSTMEKYERKFLRQFTVPLPENLA